MSAEAGALLRARLLDQWRLLALSAIAAALAAALEVAPAWLAWRLADALLRPQPDGIGPVLPALGILIAACLRNIVMGLALMASHAAAFRLIRRLREAMVTKIARLPAGAVRGQDGALKKTVIDDAGRIEGLLAHTFPDLVAALTAPLLAATLLLLVDWRLLLAALAPLPLAMLAQARMMRHFAQHAAAWHGAEAEANAAILSYVRGLPTLKAHRRDASSLAHLRHAVRATATLAARTTRRAAASYATLLTALSANLALLLPVAILLRPELPELLLVLLLGAGLTAPLLRLLPALGMLERQRQGIARIATLLGSQESLPPRPPLRIPERFDIRFDAVRFRHVPEREVLCGVDLFCAEGTVTGLVGPSGAGKSTLLGLVPRFHDVHAGSVRIGGADVRSIPPGRLHAMVATVFQDSRLFEGTVAANLRLAIPGATDAALRRVLDAVALADALPQGLRTPLGENGAPLSGGQRQRLAIARALLKDAPILLLDEVTAHLDAGSELLVQRALMRLTAGRTVLVVAHRLATVADAHAIAVMKDGIVEATGRHPALLQCSPTYVALWSAQTGAAGWRLRSGPARVRLA